MQSVVWNEAVKINGADPDFHRRDLWDAITQGDFPEWELGLQLFDDEFADRFEFDVLDPTKLIPEEEVPVRRVGRLVLDRMVDNFFAETEQVAFCTQNIVPGIDFTNDPLLQGRNFSYLDTQVKRLGGPNFTHIPINAPKCPFANFQQDGHMAIATRATRANYEPNSWERRRWRPARGPGARLHHLRRRREPGAKRRLRAGELRRPLQPGAAVLRQPDRRSSSATSPTRSPSSSASASGPRSASGWSPACATSTTTSPRRSPTASASSDCPRPLTPPRSRVDDLPPSPALSILANPPGSFAGASSASCSPTAPTRRCWPRCARRPRRSRRNVEMIAPGSAAATT